MRLRPSRAALAATIGVATLWGAGVLRAQMPPGVLEAASPANQLLVQRGKYLVEAGDCVVCHTRDGGTPFAGGRAINTPFGKLYSANLTPDIETGIGQYSSAQFYRALHRGIARGGRHLYPAFPYTELTRGTPADVRAIRSYLFSLPPVRAPKPKNKLIFPAKYRALLAGWNLLFFAPGTFRPHPDKSPQWNRGAYLVEGLAHCGGCHTPRNLAGAEISSDAMAGARLAELGEGRVQVWYASDLRSDLHGGLRDWSTDEIVRLLKTGRTDHHGAAIGVMAEVVAHSTQHLSDADLVAIAVYLKSLPPSPHRAAPVAPAAAVMQAGQVIYQDNCQTCHQANGAGIPGVMPPLRGSIVAESARPMTGINLVLNGGQPLPTLGAPNTFIMPNYREKLDDGQIASVLTYIGNAWGNRAPAVTAANVRKRRR